MSFFGTSFKKVKPKNIPIKNTGKNTGQNTGQNTTGQNTTGKKTGQNTGQNTTGQNTTGKKTGQNTTGKKLNTAKNCNCNCSKPKTKERQTKIIPIGEYGIKTNNTTNTNQKITRINNKENTPKKSVLGSIKSLFSSTKPKENKPKK